MYAFGSSDRRADSVSARSSHLSQRACIGLTSPPPTPTIRMPATVARTAIRTGVVTVVATPIWLSAAMMPIPRMNTEAMFAKARP